MRRVFKVWCVFCWTSSRIHKLKSFMRINWGHVKGLHLLLLTLSLIVCTACPTHVPVPVPTPINYLEKVQESYDTQDMTPVLEQEINRTVQESIPCRDMSNLSISAMRRISDTHSVISAVSSQQAMNVAAIESHLTCDSLPQ